MPGRFVLAMRRLVSKLHLHLPNHMAKSLLLPLFLMIAATVAASAQQRTGTNAVRVILHPDGTKTESFTKGLVLEQFTYGKTGILHMHRMFQLDKQGQARSGVAFDGRQNLLFTMRYKFNEFDQLQQENIYNKQGKLIRRLTHTYDKKGRPLKVARSAPSNKKLPPGFERAMMRPSELEKDGKVQRNGATRSQRAPKTPNKSRPKR